MKRAVIDGTCHCGLKFVVIPEKKIIWSRYLLLSHFQPWLKLNFLWNCCRTCFKHFVWYFPSIEAEVFSLTFNSWRTRIPHWKNCLINFIALRKDDITDVSAGDFEFKHWTPKCFGISFKYLRHELKSRLSGSTLSKRSKRPSVIDLLSLHRKNDLQFYDPEGNHFPHDCRDHRRRHQSWNPHSFSGMQQPIQTMMTS